MTKANTPIRSRASKNHPCPVCGSGTKSCSVTADGMHMCRGEPRPGWSRLTREPDSVGFHHYRQELDKARPVATDWAATGRQFTAAFTQGRCDQLAKLLRLPPEAIRHLPGIGFNQEESCWTLPEYDGSGTVVGINRRYASGKPKAMLGCKRGLSIPGAWDKRTGPILIPEGASDVIALSLCGVAAVGRPAAMGGVEFLAGFLADAPPDRGIYLVGENDRKEDGKWPGKEGVDHCAPKLAAALGRPVHVVFPPEEVKDSRAWVLELAADQGETLDWLSIGGQILSVVEATATRVDPGPTLVDHGPTPPPGSRATWSLEERVAELEHQNWDLAKAVAILRKQLTARQHGRQT